MTHADVVIVGGGVAGLSAAYALAEHRRVVVIEAENGIGYHSSGRSGAVFGRSYGNATVLRLNGISARFFEVPPDGFTSTPLYKPRPWLIIGRLDQAAAIKAWREKGTGLTLLDPAAVEGATQGLIPTSYGAEGLLDESCGDLDVHALLEGYQRKIKLWKGEVNCHIKLEQAAFNGKRWSVVTSDGVIEAPLLVNAAGAWADDVALRCGLAPIGLTPFRRTALLIDPPSEIDATTLPVVIDANEEFYVKPEGRRLMISPADETASPPCDAQPEELDIAIGVDRYERASARAVRRIEHRWAGLRTFAPDRTPVLGFDPRCEGFFWIAGQGGYGIQIAPALAGLTREIADGTVGEPELARALAPDRLLPGKTVTTHRMTSRAT